MKRAWIGVLCLSVPLAGSACTLFSDPEVAKGLVYGAGANAAAGGIVGGMTGGMAGAGTGMAKGAAQGTANQVLSTLPGSSSTTAPPPNQAPTYGSPYPGQAVSSLGGSSQPGMPSVNVSGQAASPLGAVPSGMSQVSAPIAVPFAVSPAAPQTHSPESSDLPIPAQLYGPSADSQGTAGETSYSHPAPQATPSRWFASRGADDQRGVEPDRSTTSSGWNMIGEQTIPRPLAAPAGSQVQEDSGEAVPVRSAPVGASPQSVSGWQLLP